MLSLEPSRIEALLGECRPYLEGARVENVYQRPGDCVTLSFYSPHAGKSVLLFCLHPRLCRFHLIAERPPSAPIPTSWCQALRKHLRGAHVESMSVASDGWTIEFVFVTRGAVSGSSARCRLAFKVSSRRPVLSLKDERGESLQTLDSSVATTTDEKESSSMLPSDFASVFMGDLSPEELAADLPPLHAEFAHDFALHEAQTRLAEQCRNLREQVSRFRRKRARLERNLERDLEAARLGEQARRQGELLNGARGQLRRGMSEIQVQDFFDPELPIVTVQLDPAATPQENIERCFKRYRKSQRGVPLIEERLARVRDEVSGLDELLRDLDSVTHSDQLVALVARARESCQPRARRRSKGPKQATVAGPRRFLSVDSVEILVGRNARGNDELTLRVARGNDLFLHVAGRAGVHTIVRTEKGKSVPTETLLDAAHLTFYYSLPDAARKRVQDGTAVDVDYTPVKYVRKPKGLPAGLVLVSKHKTLHLRVELERLQRLTIR